MAHTQLHTPFVIEIMLDPQLVTFGTRDMVSITWLAQETAARYRFEIVVEHNDTAIEGHSHAGPFQIIGQPGLVTQPQANRGQKPAAIGLDSVAETLRPLRIADQADGEVLSDRHIGIGLCAQSIKAAIL